MIYFVVRQLLRITLRVFFKNIHVSNVQHVPYDKPLVIAANHPGAFLDPVLIACLIKKPIYFLVRGDVFKNGLVRWVFEQFNMMPVYRKDEGFENIEKNHDTNAKVADVLKRNGIVVIFCEGYSSVNRRLRPVLKGAARVCMQTAVSENLDVKIVPAGISYTHKTNFRKEVMLDFSAPISMRDYLEDYRLHPQKSFVKITAELSERLAQNIVLVKHPELDEFTELHLNYFRNTAHLPFLPIMLRNNERLTKERSIAARLDHLYEHKLSAFELLKASTFTYEAALISSKLKDKMVMATFQPLQDVLFLLFGSVFFMIGFLFWGIPFLISKYIADKKVYRIDFHDSITVNATNVLFALNVFIQSLVLSHFIGWYCLLLYFLAPPISIFSGYYYDRAVRFIDSLKSNKRRFDLITLRPLSN